MQVERDDVGHVAQHEHEKRARMPARAGRRAQAHGRGRASRRSAGSAPRRRRQAVVVNRPRRIPRTPAGPGARALPRLRRAQRGRTRPACVGRSLALLDGRLSWPQRPAPVRNVTSAWACHLELRSRGRSGLAASLHGSRPCSQSGCTFMHVAIVPQSGFAAGADQPPPSTLYSVTRFCTWAACAMTTPCCTRNSVRCASSTSR